MKSDHEVKLTLRLNTKDSRQQRALSLIRGSGRSITSTIVDAVIAADNAGCFLRFKQEPEKTIRETIESVLSEFVASSPLPAMKAEAETSGEISDEAFDIADSFFNAL